jgi:hypothetical protein
MRMLQSFEWLYCGAPTLLHQGACGKALQIHGNFAAAG